MRYYKFATKDIAHQWAVSTKIEAFEHEKWFFPDTIINNNGNGRVMIAGSIIAESINQAIERNLLVELSNREAESYCENVLTFKRSDGTMLSFNPEAVYYSSYSRMPTVSINSRNHNISDLSIVDLGPESSWSAAKSKVITFTDSYMKEQIRARYGFFSRPRNGKSNIVIDSFFPGFLYAANLNTNLLNTFDIPATSVAISPFIANLMNVKQIPIEQLVRVLGYTVKDIKTLLLAVKAKEYTFAFAGMGGTGMNTAYFLTQLCEMTNTINLFKQVSAYDKEVVEMSNLLRFPIDMRCVPYQNSIYKVDIAAYMLDRLSRNKVELIKSYIDSNHYPYTIYDRKYDYETKVSTYTIRPKHIVYGAPGIEHRDALSAAGGFICATHAATSCSIWLNPKQDLSIQVESYGLIQLGGFFMNQLKMAISLLEVLASNTDLMEQDKELLEYEFDGTIQLPTERQYNWQIDRNLLMMADNQLATI